MATPVVDNQGALGLPYPDPPRRRAPRTSLKLRNALVGWTFVLPNFAGFAVLTLIPVLLLFYYSLTSWNIFGNADWVGLENYRRLLADQSFHIALGNTFYYAAFHIPLTIAASLGLALLLNQKLRGAAFFRTVAFFPYVTSIVAVAVVWNMLFSPEFGPINQFIGMFVGGELPGWTVSKDWAMPAVIIVGTWRYMGYYMLLFLAGLQTVPTELHEAARIDGAGVWQRFWNVTLPCLRPTMFLVTVMVTIESFKVFDLILVMTEGGPGQATLVLSQYIWQKGFEQFELGYASSVAVVLFLICIGVTVVQFLYNKRRDA